MLIPTTILSACSPAKPVTYSAVPIQKPALILPQVSKLDLAAVDYIVITKDNASEVFSQLEKDGKPVVLFALTSDGYKAVSLNMASILELVSQQKSIIAAYQRYYVQTSDIIDAHNAKQ